MTRSTCLESIHRERGARMVPFAGWLMPVLYRDITSEHRAVRGAAGLFDLCHMGRVRFRGADADRLADRVISLDVSKLRAGRTRYALICEEDGGITDDVLVSREADALLLVVNAGNRETDLAFFREAADGLDVRIDDDSEREAMIAVQGPSAAEVLASLGYPEAGELKYYTHRSLAGPLGDVIFSRTGYTGEDGFELFLPAERAPEAWTRIEEVGRGVDLVPCGLGARDTLRLEAGMPLHGHEISTSVDPYSAGLDFAVRSDRGYRGQAAHERIRSEGAPRRLIGLHAEGPRIPRQGSEVRLGDRVVGEVCSGTRSPTLDQNLATALVAADAADAAEYTLRIRDHESLARPTPLPFYKRAE